MLKIRVTAEHWPVNVQHEPHVSQTSRCTVLVVDLERDGIRGRGEASGVAVHGETPVRMAAQIERLRPRLECGTSRSGLREWLPPGGARAALDAALWDLEAKTSGVSVFDRANVGMRRSLRTLHAIEPGAPERMAAAAREHAPAPRLKLQLTGGDDLECLRAVQAARPDAWIAVDAAQCLTRTKLDVLLPHFEALGVRLIEQPVPAGEEAQLLGLHCSIPLAADESVYSIADLRSVQECFQVVNIKLDKCGGLTEALAMVREVRRLGMTPMVGCSPGTSLGIAPACVVGQLCELVELDAPLRLRRDRTPAARYTGGTVLGPEDWGFPVPRD